MSYLYKHLLNLYTIWQVKKEEQPNLSHFFNLAQFEEAKDNDLYDNDRPFIPESNIKKVIEQSDKEWFKIENIINDMPEKEWLEFSKELIHHPSLAEFLLYSHEKAFNVLFKKGFDFNHCLVKKRLTLDYMEHYQAYGEKEFIDKSFLKNKLSTYNLSPEIKKEIQNDINNMDEFYLENILCYMNLQKNHPHLSIPITEMKANMYRYAQEQSNVTLECHIGLIDYVKSQTIEINHGNEKNMSEKSIREYLRNNRNGVTTQFLNQGMKFYPKYLSKIVHASQNSRYTFKDEAFLYANVDVLNSFLEVAISFLFVETTQKLVSLGANIIKVYESDNVQKLLKDKEVHASEKQELMNKKALIDSLYEKIKLDSMIIQKATAPSKLKI